MVTVRPACTEDGEAICRLLQERMNPRFGLARWQRLMSYPWLEPKPNLGTVATDDGRVVGYIGAIHATRTFGAQTHQTVNLSSWYLERRYRGGRTGVELLRQASAEPATTYSVFSSRPRVLRLMRRFGFRELEVRRYVWRRRAGGASGLEVKRGTEAVQPYLDAAGRRLLADHDACAVEPVLARTPTGDCLLILSINPKGAGVLWHDALYVDNPAVLARHGQGIADTILPRGDAVLAADRRFVAESAASATLEAIPAPRYYRPGTLEPGRIDFLYSEIPLLDLKLL